VRVFPRSDEVTVRVAACGVCQSDAHYLSGGLKITYPAVLVSPQSPALMLLWDSARSAVCNMSQHRGVS
jgi:hypothetical protein